jgi:adenosine deaminase CECR1
MILADQTYKKRKRISRTPLPSSRTPIKTAIPDTTMASKNEQERKDQEDFDKFLRLEANEEFQKKKTKLIEAETNNAWDHKARKEASENERRAEVIIRQMRDFERREVFRNVASEELPPDDSQDMGGQFLTNKARIEQKSKLYQLAKEVPKGAILHLHFNAELNPERLLEEARSMNNMFVWSNQCLRTDKDLAATEMMFKIMPDNTKSNNIFSEKYIAGGKTFNDSEKDQQVWMRWTEFRKVFSEKFPNLRSREAVDTAKTCSEQGSSALDPAENWILQKMVLDADEAYDPQQTVNGYANTSKLLLLELG